MEDRNAKRESCGVNANCFRSCIAWICNFSLDLASHYDRFALSELLDDREGASFLFASLTEGSNDF